MNRPIEYLSNKFKLTSLCIFQQNCIERHKITRKIKYFYDYNIAISILYHTNCNRVKKYIENILVNKKTDV